LFHAKNRDEKLGFRNDESVAMSKGNNERMIVIVECFFILW